MKIKVSHPEMNVNKPYVLNMRLGDFTTFSQFVYPHRATVAISWVSALSKIHLCLFVCPAHLHRVCACVHVCVRALSLSCTWRGTWSCQLWVTITTSSLLLTCWTLPWALRRFVPSFPLSHTMANRCECVLWYYFHISSVFGYSLLLFGESWNIWICLITFQLVLTVGLLAVVVYLYTVLAFNFFRKFYNKSEDKDTRDMKCNDMLTVRKNLNF